MMLRPALLLLVAVLAWPLAAAQTDPNQAAAEDLEPLLTAPSLLAATAALFHDDQGRYPTTPFDLLGSPTAGTTGLRSIVFADLGVSASADTLRLVYLLTPTAEVPTEHGGAVLLTRTADGYTARFRLIHRDDADFSSRMLPLAEADLLRVRNARGELCLDLARTRRLLAQGPLTPHAPYFGNADGLTVAFTRHGGADLVGTALLTPDL